MKILQFKKKFLTICMIGCLLAFLGIIIFSLSFVGSHLSSDGVLEAETIQIVQGFQIICIFLGSLAVAYGALAILQPSILKTFLPYALAAIIIFILTAYIRNIDGDEGAYLTASHLVVEGKMPYLDFFYQQTPLLPYLYGIWMSAFGFSYFGGRTLSAVSSIFVALLLAWYLNKKFKNKRIVYSCFLLFVFNGMVISWFTVVKTYALSSLLLIGCFLTLSSWNAKNQTRYHHLLIAGFLLGIVSNIRLYVVALLPVLLIWIFFSNFRKVNYLQLAGNIFLFIAGFILSSFLSIYLCVRDFNAFYFDNLGYHLTRSRLGLFSGLFQKVSILFQLMSSSQLFLIFSIAIGSCLIIFHLCISERSLARYKDETLAFLMLITLFFVSLLPKPTYTQYFTIIVPFLIILLPPFFEEFLNNFSSWSRSSLVIVLVIYILLGFPTAYVELRRMGSQTREWQVSHVELIGKEVAKVTRKEDNILTSWPGYSFAAGRHIAPGMENHYTRETVNLLSVREAKILRIASNEDVRNLIEGKTAPAVVVGNYIELLGNNELHVINTLLQKNYELYKQIGQTKIYLPKPDNGRQGGTHQ